MLSRCGYSGIHLVCSMYVFRSTCYLTELPVVLIVGKWLHMTWFFSHMSRLNRDLLYSGLLSPIHLLYFSNLYSSHPFSLCRSYCFTPFYVTLMLPACTIFFVSLKQLVSPFFLCASHGACLLSFLYTALSTCPVYISLGRLRNLSVFFCCSSYLCVQISLRRPGLLSSL